MAGKAEPAGLTTGHGMDQTWHFSIIPLTETDQAEGDVSQKVGRGGNPTLVIDNPQTSEARRSRLHETNCRQAPAQRGRRQ